MSKRISRSVLAVVSVGLVSLCVPAADAADPARYRAYYDIFNRGNSLIPGHDSRWIPQGLTYWPDREALIISYYDGDKKLNSRLAVIDRASGKKQSIFELPERGHVGGLAMSRTCPRASSSATARCMCSTSPGPRSTPARTIASRPSTTDGHRTSSEVTTVAARAAARTSASRPRSHPCAKAGGGFGCRGRCGCAASCGST
jgi:hypothetical protein